MVTKLFQAFLRAVERFPQDYLVFSGPVECVPFQTNEVAWHCKSCEIQAFVQNSLNTIFAG